MDYGNNVVQYYIRIKEMKTNLISPKALGCFTFMGMTATTGEPVLCIYLLAAKSVSFTYVKGFDYRASIPYDSSKTLDENISDSKAIPGLPFCK